jgi:hypothetical protein
LFSALIAALAPAGLGAQERLGTAVQDGLTNLPAPELTEDWTPVRKVAPGARDGAPPADAAILFDGSSLSAWKSVNGGPVPWKLDAGDLVLAPKTGDIQSVETFGDAQIHMEWMAPVLTDNSSGQNRSNTGVYIQGRYEVQILDSHTNTTYSNGQAGSIYKQYAPLVNPARPAGEWQTYDIVFIAPRFAPSGALVSPARVTVFFNGVLVQNNVELKGSTVFRGPPSYVPHGPGPLLLQDHKAHEIRFRNIWVRRLD